MADHKEMIDQIRKVIGWKKQEPKKFTKETFTSNFETTTLADGTLIGTDSEQPYAVGDVLYMLMQDGSVQPVKAGDYTLPDGRVLTCDETGTITAISGGEAQASAPATPAATAQVAQSTVTAPATEENPVTIDLKPINDKITSIENSIADLIKQIQALTEHQTKMQKVVQIIADQPDAELITRTDSGSTGKVEKQFLSNQKQIQDFGKYFNKNTPK